MVSHFLDSNWSLSLIGDPVRITHCIITTTKEELS